MRTLVSMMVYQAWENCIGIADDGTLWGGKPKGGDIAWRQLNNIPQDEPPQGEMKEWTPSCEGREYVQAAKRRVEIIPIDLENFSTEQLRGMHAGLDVLIDRLQRHKAAEGRKSTDCEKADPSDVQQELDESPTNQAESITATMSACNHKQTTQSVASDTAAICEREYHNTQGAIRALREAADEIAKDIAYLEKARKEYKKDKQKKEARDCRARLFSLKDVQARIHAAIVNEENELPNIAQALAAAQAAQASS